MTSPARLRDRFREQTQTAILEAAGRILAEEGAALARIDAIAAEAGVSVGTLYNHFGDRDGLVTAVFRHQQAQLLGLLQAVMAEPSAGFAEDLRKLLQTCADFAASHGRLFAEMVHEGAGLRAWQSQQRDEVLDALRGLMTALVARGVAEGVVQPRPDGLHVLMLIPIGRMLLVGSRILGQPIEPAALVELYLRGVAPRKEAAC